MLPLNVSRLNAAEMALDPVQNKTRSYSGDNCCLKKNYPGLDHIIKASIIKTED